MYFQIDSEELDHVIKYINPWYHEVESAPPTLEDLFMSIIKGMEEV